MKRSQQNPRFIAYKCMNRSNSRSIASCASVPSFGAATQSRHVPRQLRLCNRLRHAQSPALRPWDHPLKSFFGQNLVQSRAHLPAKARCPRAFRLSLPRRSLPDRPAQRSSCNPVGNFLRKSVNHPRSPTANRLAENQHIRFKILHPRESAGPAQMI